MILSYCTECEHHIVVEIEDEAHSMCTKEKCLCVYAKCIREVALKKFILENGYYKIKKDEGQKDATRTKGCE